MTFAPVRLPGWLLLVPLRPAGPSHRARNTRDRRPLLLGDFGSAAHRLERLGENLPMGLPEMLPLPL